MFLIGEIGGRRQRARVSSPRMNVAGRGTTYVRWIPGRQQDGWVGEPGAHVSAGQSRGHTVPCTGLREGSERVTLAQGPATTQLGPPPSPDLTIVQEKPEIASGREISCSVLALFGFILFSCVGSESQRKQMYRPCSALRRPPGTPP